MLKNSPVPENVSRILFDRINRYDIFAKVINFSHVSALLTTVDRSECLASDIPSQDPCRRKG